jgi:branched-chain amino acid transport system ATP-binding protein
VILSATELVAGYGPLRILNGLTLSASSDQITVLIGPNGAGKSTFLKAVAGFIDPWSGSISLDGLPFIRKSPWRLIPQGLLYIPQDRSVFPDLTVDENLRMGAYTIGGRAETEAALVRAYEAFPDLKHRRSQLAGSLSGGERRFVELARIVMLNPRLVLMDEPSIGLSPRAMKSVYAGIVDLHGAGTGFLIVEQNVNMGLQVSDVVHVLELGTTVWSGSPSLLRSNDTLRSLYLGSAAARLSTND